MTPGALSETDQCFASGPPEVRGAFERIAGLDEGEPRTREFVVELLELFSNLADADRALLLVNEGDAWTIRASIGIPACIPGENRAVPEELLSCLPREIGPISAGHSQLEELAPTLMGDRDRGALYGGALFQDDVPVGLLLVGFRHSTPTDAELRLLNVVATRIRGAIVREQSFQTLEMAISARDDAIGVVAHDLRNPINVISLAANSLHQRMPDAPTRRIVERILRAAQRGDRLIRDLLEVTAIQAGQFTIERRPIEPASTILAAVESQQGLAASASIILAADVDPELPSIEGDDERLLEVLENLIGNAVKFTDRGGTVIVGANCHEDEIRVWVKDTGQGIPAEHLPRLFDRFWQARKRDRRGTGLGLTICKGIVEAHGGTISAESTLGQGTTVYFTLPANGAESRTIKPVLSNILVVDDRPENLLSLKAILDRPDYRLFTARSGEEALSLTLREQFSVALIDVAMPGMDGLEVAVLMKELERSRDIPIIFITAFGDDPEEVHRAYAAGAADYLVKPLDAEIVRKKVAVFVDLNRRREQAQ